MSFVNPFAPRRQLGYPDAIDRLKRETQQLLDLTEDDVVLVTEASCSEPGCPDVETVVAILRKGERPQIGRVHKPMPRVETADLVQAFANVFKGREGG